MTGVVKVEARGKFAFATSCYETEIDPRQAAEIFDDTPQVLGKRIAAMEKAVSGKSGK